MSKRYLSTNVRGGGPLSSADGDAFSGLLKTSRTRCKARGGTCTGPGPTWTPVNAMKSDIPLEWPSRYVRGTRRTAQEHAVPCDGQGGVLHTDKPGPSAAWLVLQSSGLERTPAPRLGHVRWGGDSLEGWMCFVVAGCYTAGRAASVCLLWYTEGHVCRATRGPGPRRMWSRRKLVSYQHTVYVWRLPLPGHTGITWCFSWSRAGQRPVVLVDESLVQ